MIVVLVNIAVKMRFVYYTIAHSEVVKGPGRPGVVR